MSELRRLIQRVETFIPDPSKGLPEDVFLFATRITPMVNVDLLIKNDRGQTLLTWRDDDCHNKGWHIPGGIVRFRETFSDRITETALRELGTGVSFDPVPVTVVEVIVPERTTRGHFISFLYACTLKGEPSEVIHYLGGKPFPGEWKWHDGCPGNIIPEHFKHYKKFF